MQLTIPELSFVVLIGVSGSGKSTFARKHFKPTEILSSDACRGLVSDDENSQPDVRDHAAGLSGFRRNGRNARMTSRRALTLRPSRAISPISTSVFKSRCTVLEVFPA